MSEAEAGEDQLEELLEYVRTSRGFDFTGYKRTTLRRRITKRMGMLGIEDYAHYLDRLQVDPPEFACLFDFILINITRFFRDPEAWEALRSEVIPRIVENRSDSEPIRVWSAGCAAGQEAYSIAIAFAEALGKSNLTSLLKIYATDVDQEALATARQGVFSAKEVQDVPSELLPKYFDQVGPDSYAFDKVLRRCMIFGRHDLMQDAPISHIDLLACRNTLMYLNSEAQAKIMSRFYFGLSSRGFLMLGKAEMMFGYNRLFVPVNLKQRIFAKRLQTDGIEPARAMPDRETTGANLDQNQRAREIAVEAASVAQIIVDRSGTLTLANNRARELFGMSRADLGRPFQDLEISYNPAELRSLMNRAQSEGRPAGVTGVPFRTGTGFMHLDIEVVPLYENEGALVGVSMLFFDVSHETALRDELEQSNQELETAMEELQTSNEELETTNEELQSTNEELETTNEELQSTNEELETMNEELQSTNEELSATNDELRSRSSELNQLNVLLETMMESIKAAFILLDTGLRVKIWNRKSFEMWGLEEREVLDQAFLTLEMGLDPQALGPALMSALSGQATTPALEVPAINRRGRSFSCRVTITPISDQKKVDGLILMFEELPLQQ